LALKEVDIRFEAVVLPHFDGEEMMIVLLGEEQFSYHLEDVERARR